MTVSAKTFASLACVALLAGCATFYEIPIETPLTPKLDISKFQRVLIAGVVAGGSEDVDANIETARLLRSQLRRNSELEVIDADVLPLLDIAGQQADPVDRDAEAQSAIPDGFVATETDEQEDPTAEDDSMSEEELEAYETIFANVGYWRDLGEEYQNPLILTGTVYFSPHARSGMVTREREVYDSFGRRRTVPVRTYRDRRGFILSPEVHLHRRRNRRHPLHRAAPGGNPVRRVPEHPGVIVLFRVNGPSLPSVLGAFSTQSISGTRTLLK